MSIESNFEKRAVAGSGSALSTTRKVSSRYADAGQIFVPYLVPPGKYEAPMTAIHARDGFKRAVCRAVVYTTGNCFLRAVASTACPFERDRHLREYCLAHDRSVCSQACCCAVGHSRGLAQNPCSNPLSLDCAAQDHTHAPSGQHSRLMVNTGHSIGRWSPMSLEPKFRAAHCLNTLLPGEHGFERVRAAKRVQSLRTKDSTHTKNMS